MIGLSRRSLLAAAGAMVAGSRAAAREGVPPLSLRRGVNLWPWFSLTREYPAPRVDYAWPPYQPQRPVPTRRDLARLREVGFDFVRIPVDPGPLLAFEERRRQVLLDDIVEATSACVEHDLSAIVCLAPNTATHHFTPAYMIGSAAAPGFLDYLGLVGDLARRLGRLPSSKIALEPVNEPPHPCGSPTWPSMQRVLLETARAAAPDLILVASGACGSSIEGLEALDAATLLRFEPILFTFHFYEPFLFSHQGAPWMNESVYRSLNGVPWPSAEGRLDTTLAAVRHRMATDDDRSDRDKADAYRETEKVLAEYFEAAPDARYIDSKLQPALTWARRFRIKPDRIILGEFGALATTGPYVASRADDRARYLHDVRSAAETLGFPWCVWALFDGMGIMDDDRHVFDRQILRALGLG